MAKRRIQESLGERLARIRRDRGITQDELAEKLGIAQPNISGYERDLYQPNAAMIIQVAKVLGVSTDVLLGFEPMKSEADQLDRAVLRRLRRITDLSRRNRTAVLRTLDAFLNSARSG